MPNRFVDEDLEWLKKVSGDKTAPPNSVKFNPYHKPAGSSEGGQFTSADEAGGEDGGGPAREHPGEGYSDQAWVDENGVIHTDNVYDAARALGQDRQVDLSQPETVSTLIEHLGQVAKNMELMGERAPTFNLCNVTLEGTDLFCVKSLGIPRVQMPQLDEQQTKDFIDYLKAQGYGVSKGSQYASYLRATQNELNGVKVARNMARIDSGQINLNKTRLIISKDNYILDGHHRWAADIGINARDGNLSNDKKMKVTRISVPITTLLREAETFTGGKGHQAASYKRR